MNVQEIAKVVKDAGGTVLQQVEEYVLAVDSKGTRHKLFDHGYGGRLKREDIERLFSSKAPKKTKTIAGGEKFAEELELIKGVGAGSAKKLSEVYNRFTLAKALDDEVDIGVTNAVKGALEKAFLK